MNKPRRNVSPDLDAFLSAILVDYISADDAAAAAEFAAAILDNDALVEAGDPRGVRTMDASDYEFLDAIAPGARKTSRGVNAPAADDSLFEYDPDEPRDSRGRWTTGGPDADRAGGASRKDATKPSRRRTKISWSDFQGKPPANAAEKEAAQIRWNYRPPRAGGLEGGVVGKTIDGKKTYHAAISAPNFQQGVTMNKGDSWCVKGAESDDLLQHEQLHLSIAEENAATAQDKIRSITGEGTGSTRGEAIAAAEKDLSSQSAKVLDKMKQIDTQLDAENGKYDQDTNHGLDKDGQKSWNENFEKNVRKAWGS